MIEIGEGQRAKGKGKSKSREPRVFLIARRGETTQPRTARQRPKPKGAALGSRQVPSCEQEAREVLIGGQEARFALTRTANGINTIRKLEASL
jgi:hypothetical protein